MDDTCGAVCQVHLDACGVCDPPDGGGAGAILGLHEVTLDEHRRLGRHLCVGTDPPHFWEDEQRR